MGATTLRTDQGVTVRDLNKNGKLDPYEDPRRPVEERVEDLLSQMTVEEKAGMMFHTPIDVNPDGTLVERDEGPFRLPSSSEMVTRKLLNHFNVFAVAEPRRTAEWY